ncbi:peptide chain release factor 1 [Carboxylicivirga sp. M1479]|uniref:peptide chain release factor 1 n=1 Tax=Carboxylicivirga sp. M1479 TaxID=2594476 RepID=UPI001178C213|nr:peptide chain release factor 1 [Carboxylicivirga sp. M1479]TRX71390.1 peptide chain release factor 1 [Carboxylicivirga sp. M1479]
MAKHDLLEKLEGLRLRFLEVSEQITNPEVITDTKRYIKLNKEYSELEKVVAVRDDFENTLKNIDSTKEMLKEETDPEMKEMAKMELDELEAKLPVMEEEIKVLLIPADPQDAKNAVLEIRAGTGGDEASIFAGELARMYTKYCQDKGWRVEVTNSNEGTSGGFKEIVMNVTGNGVYGILKYESGVHRVQRVPQTETQGRVHTSAATVAALPEAEEFDIELRTEDIRKDTYCASGPGGQSVNTTYSAIRLTHTPSGIVVTCQDQKSQLKNLDKAMTELRTRLYNLEYQKHLDEISSQRKTLVSSGDRSAKIRTYNYPQGRVTDHRINLTLYNLPAVMDGDIQQIIDKLIVEENAERLKANEM